MQLRSCFLGVGSLVVVSLLARSAGAQTSAAMVTASGQLLPERFAPDGVTDLGTGSRPANLTPNGISFADCMEDQILRFTVAVSGFDGNENMQVWASTGSPCTDPGDRGINPAGASVCWFLQQAINATPYLTSQSIPVNIPVRDIVGFQQATLPIRTPPRRIRPPRFATRSRRFPP